MSNSMSSASVITTTNNLLLEILLRLPVKSLLSFKSVSKRWLSLISDPSFINNHSLRTITPSIPALFLQMPEFLRSPDFQFIFLDGKTTNTQFKFHNFANDPRGLMIHQSCNGLLCCSSVRENQSKSSYYIYNPSTKHFITLPISLSQESQKQKDFPVSVCSISLAFNPLKSPHYKAICVLHNKEEDVYKIEIYSSETASWKFSADVSHGFRDIAWKSGVFWNGSLHWVSSKSDFLYFDVEQELLKTMPNPPRPGKKSEGLVTKYFGEFMGHGKESLFTTMYFGEFKGHLHLIEGYGTHCTKFDILEMEMDYSGWKVKYCVNLDPLIIACPEMSRHEYELDWFTVLFVIDEEENELSSLVLQIPDKVISYNLKDMTFKKIHEFSPGHIRYYGRYRWSNVFGYIETLACV